MASAGHGSPTEVGNSYEGYPIGVSQVNCDSNTSTAAGQINAWNFDLYGYRTAQKSDLSRHMRSHTGVKPYMCAGCGYRTANRFHLSRHMRTHTGETPYKCDQCDYSAAQKYNLDKHLQKHTGEKPYMCGECGYRTAYRSHLSRHIRTHTGEKPYKCDQCDYSAAHKYSLDKHLQKHTGEKPYMCEECGYRTAYRSVLSQHMRTHTGEKPYRCDQCDYSAAQKANLNQHLAKHTGEKPYMCEECGYKTAYKTVLSQHIRTLLFFASSEENYVSRTIEDNVQCYDEMYESRQVKRQLDREGKDDDESYLDKVSTRVHEEGTSDRTSRSSARRKELRGGTYVHPHLGATTSGNAPSSTRGNRGDYIHGAHGAHGDHISKAHGAHGSTSQFNVTHITLLLTCQDMGSRVGGKRGRGSVGGGWEGKTRRGEGMRGRVRGKDQIQGGRTRHVVRNQSNSQDSPSDNKCWKIRHEVCNRSRMGTIREESQEDFMVNHEDVAWNPEGRAEGRGGDTAFTDGFQARGLGVEGNEPGGKEVRCPRVTPRGGNVSVEGICK
ncbi:hypothetical protein Bbelb_377940 [Branchiostoma belcheri]|nr:hypothetical protein Bbelb_377940 [Branchiostoma belcheri]